MRAFIPEGLPAQDVLRNENIFFNVSEDRSATLKILVLNLMPTKQVTETQLIRKLALSGVDFELSLMRTESYRSVNTDSAYLDRFYRGFSDYRDMYFDGMIITGAPVEQLDFEQVYYWKELCDVIDWSKDHVRSVYSICWGAQAVLYHLYGTEKFLLDEKLFGIYDHNVLIPDHPMCIDLPESFLAPHSRHADVHPEDLYSNPDLDILSETLGHGVFLCASKNMHNVFAFGHPEYDAETLSLEYFRDENEGKEIHVPYNYFPDNKPTLIPVNSWEGAGNAIYGSWMKFLKNNK